MIQRRTVLDMQEYRPFPLPAGATAEQLVERLSAQHSSKFVIEYPSPRTNGQFRVTPGGWVGSIPVSKDLRVRISPKVPIRSVLAMLEFVYKLDGIFFTRDRTDTGSIDDVFSSIANILALRVIHRSRRGLYREYLRRSERLTSVRGRIDLADRMHQPWAVEMTCEFDDHTADIPHNQIIAWTLYLVTRLGFEHEAVMRHLRAALVRISSAATAVSVRASACDAIVYNRLNEDYKLTHQLCRFFLDHAGPSETSGHRESIPFLVDMEKLYEDFVSSWLDRNRPPQVTVRSQVSLPLAADYSFRPDIVLYDSASGAPVWVLDTKYKKPDRVDLGDVAQVVAYAHGLGAAKAALVYPVDPGTPLSANIRGIRIQTTTFALAAKPNVEGQRFLNQLGLESKTVHAGTPALLGAVDSRSETRNSLLVL